MIELMEYLTVSLPEDVEKAKWHGDFKRAERLIDKHLQYKSNFALQKRLLIEKEVLKRLPDEYPYNETEALELIQKEIPDFTMDELHAWEDCGGADWLYVNGEVHLQDRFFASMKKVYPEIAKRAGLPVNDTTLLDENVRVMKQNGESRYRFHIRASIRMHDDVFEKGKVLVHLPLPAKCLNMENIKILSYSDGGVIDDENALSRTISFCEDMTENHEFFVEYEYDSVMKYHDLFTDMKCGNIHSFTEYTKEELPQIRFTPTIQKLCHELTDGVTSPREKAWNIYRYCTEQVRYSFMRCYLTIPNIPEYLANQRIGDCGVMALLFITLCRCAGIPAHWQSGLYVTPDSVGNHDWAMFYLEEYGWLFADPSFGNSAFHSGNLERQKYYFGNLDPFRMAANNALMKEFHPAKTQWRNDPYDNQSGEIEYVDRKGLTSKDFERERVILSAHKVSD